MTGILNFSLLDYERAGLDEPFSTYQFEVKQNYGGGDCLFRALAQCRTNGHEGDHEAERRRLVQHIIDRRNWPTFKEFLVGQHLDEIPAFKDTSASDETLRIKYRDYMSRIGNYGTLGELEIASKMYPGSFNFSVMRLNDDTHSASVQNYRTPHAKDWYYFLFSGRSNSGHWEKMDPLFFETEESSEFPSGIFMEVGYTNHHLYLSNQPELKPVPKCKRCLPLNKLKDFVGPAAASFAKKLLEKTVKVCSFLPRRNKCRAELLKCCSWYLFSALDQKLNNLSEIGLFYNEGSRDLKRYSEVPLRDNLTTLALASYEVEVYICWLGRRPFISHSSAETKLSLEGQVGNLTQKCTEQEIRSRKRPDSKHVRFRPDADDPDTDDDYCTVDEPRSKERRTSFPVSILQRRPSQAIQYSFNGSRVIIFGGANGIGGELAKMLIADKAEVLLVDPDEERLKQLRNAHPGLLTLASDYQDFEVIRGELNTVDPFIHLIIVSKLMSGDILEYCPSTGELFGWVRTSVPIINYFVDEMNTKGVPCNMERTVVHVFEEEKVQSTSESNSAFECASKTVKAFTKYTGLGLLSKKVRINSLLVIPTEFCHGCQCSSGRNLEMSATNASLYLSSQMSEMIFGETITVDNNIY